jgi:hypothetical protein
MSIFDIPDDILEDRVNGAKKVYRDKPLALAVITYGLSKLRSKRKQERRREIKAELQPEVLPPNKDHPRPYAKFSDHAKNTMSKLTTEYLGVLSGWHIGKRSLGEFTRPELLDQIASERRAGNGHFANANWYEALIEPMKRDDQTVLDFWRKYKGPQPTPPDTRPSPPKTPHATA